MIPRPHDNNGSVLPPDSVALVASASGNLQFLVPADWDIDLSSAQLFLSAIALRSTDADWVKEQLDFIIEVRRALDERGDDNLLN